MIPAPHFTLEPMPVVTLAALDTCTWPCCPECGEPLLLDQPDADSPQRLVGRCPDDCSLRLTLVLIPTYSPSALELAKLAALAEAAAAD